VDAESYSLGKKYVRVAGPAFKKYHRAIVKLNEIPMKNWTNWQGGILRDCGSSVYGAEQCIAENQQWTGNPKQCRRRIHFMIMRLRRILAAKKHFRI